MRDIAVIGDEIRRCGAAVLRAPEGSRHHAEQLAALLTLEWVLGMRDEAPSTFVDIPFPAVPASNDTQLKRGRECTTP